MKIDDSSKYILAIVFIVAVVGIVVLVLNSGRSVSFSDTDVTGQADTGVTIKEIISDEEDTCMTEFNNCKDNCDKELEESVQGLKTLIASYGKNLDAIASARISSMWSSSMDSSFTSCVDACTRGFMSCTEG